MSSSCKFLPERDSVRIHPSNSRDLSKLVVSVLTPTKLLSVSSSLFLSQYVQAVRNHKINHEGGTECI